MFSVYRWLFFLEILIYLVLLGINSLTRLRKFAPDSMNYVDIARNIVAGRGITQSALGFNERCFQVDDQAPKPTSSQPPLYPLLIAILNRIGFSSTDAALVIPVFSYALVLIIAYLLARELYNENVALMAVLTLSLYYPLMAAATCALSETTGILFLLLSFFFLVGPDDITLVPSSNIIFIGVLSGLAFITRYALLPVFFLCVLFLANSGNWSWALQNIGLYTMGFFLPAGLVLARNKISTNYLMGAPRNDSDLNLRQNFRDTFRAVFGNYLGDKRSAIQTGVLVTSVIVLGSILTTRNEAFATIKSVFMHEKRWVLTFWSFGYLGFLIYLRTRFYFSNIRPRLITPASPSLIILWSALLISTLKLQVEDIIYPALIFGSLPIYRQIQIFVKTPVKDLIQLFTSSERLSWVAKNVTHRDLVIGDDTVDIPFLLGRQCVISFSPYPYSDYLEYNTTMSYVCKHANKYDHVYLVIRKRFNSEKNWQKFCGAFISDIVHGKMEKYPGIIHLDSLSDSYILEVRSREYEKE